MSKVSEGGISIEVDGTTTQATLRDRNGGDRDIFFPDPVKPDKPTVRATVWGYASNDIVGINPNGGFPTIQFFSPEESVLTSPVWPNLSTTGTAALTRC